MEHLGRLGLPKYEMEDEAVIEFDEVRQRAILMKPRSGRVHISIRWTVCCFLRLYIKESQDRSPTPNKSREPHLNLEDSSQTR